MRIPLYQIDAFTDELFHGNPAAVCPLEEWLPEDVMQKIAAENNLAETAFYVPSGENFQLRWFTPTTEVDLCGHATLASAYVIAHLRNSRVRRIVFTSRSGPLAVDIDGERIRLDFPAAPPQSIAPPPGLAAALGFTPAEVWAARNGYLLALASTSQVREARPAAAALMQLEYSAVIVTAAGEDCDFVSRFFAPRLGVLEDPVTGSAHCVLAPYWAARLGKNYLRARQCSARGGELICEARGERVWIAGKAAKYLEGVIEI